MRGGCRARVWEGGPSCPCPRPRRVSHCEETWQGRPSCFIVCAIFITQHSINCSDTASLEVWCHIIVIWHPSIPVHLSPSRLPWTELPKSMPMSYVHGRYSECPSERVPCPHLRGSPPTHDTSASVSMCSCPSGVVHGTLTGTWRGCVGQKRGACWPRMMHYSSPEHSGLGQ